jgi:hypothetical protein
MGVGAGSGFRGLSQAQSAPWTVPKSEWRPNGDSPRRYAWDSPLPPFCSKTDRRPVFDTGLGYLAGSRTKKTEPRFKRRGM